MNREFRRKAHSRSVSDWMKGSKTFNNLELLEFLERGLTSLLTRARPAVSEVTLKAVLDRVIYNSFEHYPILADLKCEEGTLNFQPLKQNLDGKSEADIVEAFQYFLTDLLTTLGNLSAEQLTPALYNALEKASVNNSDNLEKKERS